MRNVPSFVAILLFPFVTHVTSAKPAPSASPSGAKNWSPPDISVRLQTSGKPTPAKEWSPPDVSVKLQAYGKASASAKTLREHLSTAGRLYRDKQYPEAASEYEKCVEIDPADFQANLFLGFSYYHLRRFDAAAKALRRACELNSEDFDANVWLGVSLARGGLFKEAIVHLEKAHALKPESDLARRELFTACVAGAEFSKASAVYPKVIWFIGQVFLVIYCLWLAALLPFSLPISEKTGPGYWLFLGWFGLSFEGQIAFLFVLASLPWLPLHETVLSGAILAALPIIVVGLTGFARQPWGEPFRWPPRFGSAKVVVLSLLLVLAVGLVGIGNAYLYTQLTGKPFPVPRVLPLIKNALKVNPAVAWLSVAVVIPFVEEILFRGLLFGAFEKHWGVKAAVWASALVFVLVHLQIIGFLPLLFLGVLLAWARVKTGSIALPILLHGLNNAIATAMLAFAPPAPTS